MLAELIIWIYILIISYIYGWTIVEGISKLFSIKINLETFSLPLIILVGLCGINTFAASLSLFLNLGWLAQSIFLLLGLALGWRMWKKHVLLPSIKLASIPWWLWVFVLLVFITVLGIGSDNPVNPDTGIYHAQAIRWMETFPVVPGLGNLHSRFAYNSNWLVINAFFSFSFLGLQSFHVLPGAFVLVAIIYFMGGMNKIFKKEITVTNVIKTLLIPLVFYILGSQVSSPGTDFPANIWTWITFLIWFETFEVEEDSQHNAIRLEEILVFIFSIYLITIKLSTLPLLLLSAFIVYKNVRRNIKIIIKLLMLASIVLAPWFARNLILSGYWIYPIPLLSVISPNWDWKIPLDSVVNEKNVIQAWARIPRGDVDYVLTMPLLGWLKEWFLNRTLNQRILILGASFSPILFIISSQFVLRKFAFFRYFAYSYLVSYCGLAFWLFGAPDIRFGFGFVIITFLISGGPLVLWILRKIPHQKFVIDILLSLIFLYQASVLIQSAHIKSLMERVILPADYGQLPTKPCDIHGYTLLCAEYYNECWYDPFPCIPPGSANPQVELRGETLRSGFREINHP